MRLRFLFPILLEVLIIVWAVHFYITLEQTTLEKIFFVAFVVFAPLILSLTVYLFRRKLSRIFFIICSICLIVFFSVGYFLPSKYKKEVGTEAYVAIDHFKKKAGFFSAYKSIVVSFDYPDSISKTGQHIVKNFYRIGSQRRENYYIGKLLLDKDYTIVKEFYNRRAIEDMSLLQNEFGKTFSQMLFINDSKNF